MRRALLLGALIAAAALAAALGVLLFSESGLHWGFARLQALTPGRLSAERLTGRLAGPIRITGLRYVSDTVRVSGDRIVIAWQPLELLTGILHIKDLSVDRLQVELRESESAAPVQPFAPPRFPFALHLDAARIDGATITPAGGAPQRIDSLAFGARATARGLTLADFHLVSPQGTLAAAGRVPFSKDGRIALELQWQTELRGRTIRGGGTVAGTLERIETEQRVTAPVGLHLRASLDTRERPLRWRAAVEAEPFALARLLPEAPPLQISKLQLQASGAGAGLEARSKFAAAGPDIGRWQVNLHAVREDGAWRLPEFELVQARAGSGATTADGARVTGSAARLPDGTGASAGYRIELAWQRFGWPFDGPAQVRSTRGSAVVSGRPDDYRIDAEGELQYGALPAGHLQLRGSGDRAGVKLDTLGARWLEGDWSGTGALAWAPAPSWSLALQARGIEPAVLRPELAPLNGRLDARLRLSAGGGRLAIDLDRLSGTLRGLAVTGQARAEYTGGQWSVPQLSLAAGGAELQARARIDARWDIEWRLHAPQLAALYPQLSGSLHTRGRLTGPPRELSTDFTVSGSALAYRGYRVADLQAAAAIDLARAGRWQLVLTGAGVAVAGRPVGRVEARVTGSSDAHDVQLLAARDGQRWEQKLRGSWSAGRWQARLHDGHLVQRHIGAWDQQGTAALQLAASELTLDGWCWDKAAANLCLNGGWSGEASGAVRLRWQSFDLRDLAAWISLPEVSFTGLSDGVLSGTVAAGRPRQLTLSLAAHDGALSYRVPLDRERQTLRYRQVTATVTGDAAGGLRAEAAVVLTEAGEVSAALRLPGWDPASLSLKPAQAVSARIDLRLDDLSMVSLFVPDVLPADDGRFAGHLRVAGTLAQPRIDGQLDLDVSSLAVARLGVTFTEVDLGARIENSAWRLQGSARSGQGRFTLDGHGTVQDIERWQAELRVKGENVEVLRLPAAVAVASPDLTLRLQPGDVAVNGTVAIPEAKIQRAKAAPAAVPASEDVVIVGGAPQPAAAPPRATAVHGKIEVQLGDKVSLASDNFEGLFSGRLVIALTPEGQVTAEGELQVVEGKFTAYRQTLSITKGRLLYAGGSIDNPALDVYATRTKGEIEVGVHVTGTAQKPELQLFSSPAMDDTDILSYLFLGRPLNQASSQEGELLYRAATSLALVGGEALAQRISGRFGLEEVAIESTPETEAALVLGKQLSPRLYIRYIRGLLEDTSTFQIRYDINQHLQLETESGSGSAAGADLIYTLER